MVNILFISSTSACLEVVNESPYYAPEPVHVLVDGVERCVSETNIISLFDLAPDTGYEVCLEAGDTKETVSLHTQKESCAIDVRSFGAKGDGVSDDTTAIQTAISYLPENGRLVFPEGVYLSRPLVLKSHITIELSEHATLLGSPDRSDYPIVPGSVFSADGEEIYFGGFEGETREMYQSLITGQYASDIKIVGKGCIDGNAQNSDFWTAFKTFPTARPRLLFFNRCTNVYVHGVHACNSPSWQLHPYYSDHVGFYDVFISAPKVSPNTDAIDPESCDYVDIIGCRFSVGDDCIAIKSSKIELGKKLNKPADHHTIRNCLMDYGHGAVTLGSEIGAGVRNLSVTLCWFRGTDRGLRIKSRRGRGKNCRIDHVAFENLRMEGVLTPIAINLWYNCCDPDRYSEYVWSREKLPVDDRTPSFGSFHFRNLVCTDAEVAACYIDGLPEAPIEEVVIENVAISFAENAKPGVPIMENHAKERCRLGLYLDNVKTVSISGVTLEGVEGKKVIVDHCEKLDVPADLLED